MTSYDHAVTSTTAAVSVCSAVAACSRGVLSIMTHYLTVPATVELLQSIAAIVAIVSGSISVLSFVYHKLKK